MSEPLDAGWVLPLRGKYYGTMVDIRGVTLNVWGDHDDPTPSIREVYDSGYLTWDDIPLEEQVDMLAGNHYETQKNYEIACLIAAAPELFNVVVNFVKYHERADFDIGEWLKQAKKALVMTGLPW